MMKYSDIREECCQANQELGESGLVDLTFGNVSVLDQGAGVFAIKPSGLDYERLTPADMVIIDLEGKVVDGIRRPSSDAPTHRRLFMAFGNSGVSSIVHTHSRCAVAFAQARKAIPCLGTTHGDHFYGAVPVTREMTEVEIKGDYEWETGNVIVESFEGMNPLEIPAVLVSGHGSFIWNVSGAKAVEYARALEISADMAIKTLVLNPNQAPISQTLLHKHFSRKHGKNAYYGQGEDIETFQERGVQEKNTK